MSKRIQKPAASDPEAARRRRRGLVWLIFFVPGALMMWWQYMFPKAGEVFGSGRRLDNRFLQFAFTMGIYAFLLTMWLLFTGRLDERPPRSTTTGAPAAAAQSGSKP